MLSLNFRNCLSTVIGTEHGLSLDAVQALQPKIDQSHDEIEALRFGGKIGFPDLPFKQKEATQIMQWAKKKRKGFDTLVVLGIGGSALGNNAIQQALKPLYWNLLSPKDRKGWLRLFVLDNVDPRWTNELLGVLDLKKTLFNVISKSGTTAECLANYFYFRKAVEKKVGVKNAAKHFVFTTDTEKGYLREIAKRENTETFSVPDNVGGRFSVLTPVGLVSAALTGVDLGQLLKGAADMSKRCDSRSLEDNPAAQYAAVQYLYYQRNVKLSVLLSYSQNLWTVADWYRQLWAESLGKRVDLDGKVVHHGPTPIKALGVTDQHSQAQLYMEGPYDKVITFLSVERFGKPVIIPKVDSKHYLSGRSFDELLKAEENGTRAALTKVQRPNCTVSVSDISASSLGELFFFFEKATAYMGQLLHIDTYNQPGVELAKVYTYALMGRSGFDNERQELKKILEG